MDRNSALTGAWGLDADRGREQATEGSTPTGYRSLLPLLNVGHSWGFHSPHTRGSGQRSQSEGAEGHSEP